MNPLLTEIYSTILPSAPYIIAAYALVWLALLVYVCVSTKSLKNAEAQIEVLEEEIKHIKDSCANKQ